MKQKPAVAPAGDPASLRLGFLAKTGLWHCWDPMEATLLLSDCRGDASEAEEDSSHDGNTANRQVPES